MRPFELDRIFGYTNINRGDSEEVRSKTIVLSHECGDKVIRCHSHASRDFKAVHDFTFGAVIIRYISNRIRHVQYLISFW